MIKKILIFSFAAFALLSCGRKTIEEQMEDETRSFTLKQCPKVIDEYMTLDSITFEKASRTSVYHYSIKGKMDDPSFYPEGTQADFKENMTLNVRDDLNMKKQKEANISFEYVYHSKKTGEILMAFTITPADYTGKMKMRSFNEKKTSTSKYWTKVNCPLKAEDNSVMDSMWYDSITRTVHYDYTLSGPLDNDSTYMDPATQESLRKSLIKSLKEDEGNAIERDREKLDFQFRYYSATTKNTLIDILIRNSEL